MVNGLISLEQYVHITVFQCIPTISFNVIRELKDGQSTFDRFFSTELHRVILRFSWTNGEWA